ncbi:MAG TPA: toll/interleukin-1 receptor domain-containing protein [Pyrinomonadaceae bacterium]|nr:toll/interleukin-1 receptor domain-containing protein [Pyrinomonadaceae bacterium]
MKVFISHSHEDRALARRVGDALRRTGLEVWDDEEILPGDNPAQEIAHALEESQAMVVLLTPSTVNSTWVRREIEYALGSKSFKNRLVPVLVGSDDFPAESIPWILRHLNVIKLPAYGRQEEGINRIAEAVQAVA